MITAETITDAQIRELHAHHAALDVAEKAPGHNKHTSVMLTCGVALGVVTESYPGDRLTARARCAEILNARAIHAPLTAATITDDQIRTLFYADEIAAIDLTVATLPGWSAKDRRETRAQCADLFNARTLRLITDEKILAEYNGELGAWSVGITLSDGTHVGFGCATEAEVPGAKAQVRERCAELFNTHEDRCP